jgi:NAD(P)-dependent dehydrogenase (short-subunit alcohol dehydrogenase family)
MLKKRLEEKVAIVTGAGQGGMGEAIASELAGEGAKVVVNDIARDEKGASLADKTVEKIRQVKSVAVANYDTVSTWEGAQKIIQTAIASFGRVDILINCAGNSFIVRSFEMSLEQWKSIMDVHLNGHFYCIRAVLPIMVKQRIGRIINVSSRGAFFGSLNVAYSAAKAGILGLTTTLAEDVSDLGITVNAIVPSAKTKLFPGDKRPMGEGMPVPFVADPEYVAPIVVYLCTDEASDITGQFVYTAGGDICIYARPLQLPGSGHMLLRKEGKWTVEELANVAGPLLRLQPLPSIKFDRLPT